MPGFLDVLGTMIKDVPNKLGEMAPIPPVVARLGKTFNLPERAVEGLLYRLFVEEKVDLQPGKSRDGPPMVVDDAEFYWIKVLEVPPV